MGARPDYPFYAGQPIAISGAGWLGVLGSVAAAFAALTLIPLYSLPLNLVPVLSFVAIPLVALRATTGPRWTALFRAVGPKEVGLMVGFAALTLIASFLVAMVMSQVMDFTQNPVSDAMRVMTAGEFAGTLAATVPQLLGEELLAVLPFLAVLWLCASRLGLSRRSGIAIALVVSSLVFGAAHLPTYGWNWAQALVVIGTARVVLTLAYVATRNLWVSTGAHIFNDWAGFLFVFGFGHIPIEIGG